MPPLPRVPYLTDNPFRLLGVGSSTPLSVLRQQARAAERALQVGLPTSVYLQEILGDADLSACPNQIRALSTNAKQLLLFRIFWPLDGPEARPETAPGLDIDEEMRISVQVWQHDFLRDWLAFLAEPGPDTLDKALLAYDWVGADEYLSAYLQDLLVADGFSDTDLEALIADTWQDTRRFVYGWAARKAAELWQSGATERAADLIHTLSNQWVPDEVISEALTVFVPVGDALSRELRALAVPTAAEFIVHGLKEPECVTRLQILLRHLKPYLSQAGLWNSAWSRYVIDVGSAAHDSALHLAETTQAYSAAVALLTQLLTWPISQTWREEVEKDLARMRAALPPPSASRPAPEKKSPAIPLFRRWEAIWISALALFLIVVVSSAYLSQSDEAARMAALSRTEAPVTTNPEPSAKQVEPVKPKPGPRLETVSPPREETATDAKPPAAISPEDEESTTADPGKPPAEVKLPPVASVPAEPVQITPEPDHSARDQELDRMKGLIQAGKARLAAQKRRLEEEDAVIDQEQAVVDSLSSSLRQAKASLEKYEQDSQSGLEVDDAAYQRALDMHNALVDRYNGRLPGLRQLIARRNELFDQYKEDIQAHNRLVDDYNLKLLAPGGG